MKKKWIVFISSLILIAIFSGCIDQPDKNGIKYYNDALKLEGYKVQTRVLPNQNLFIEFWLANQVEHDVGNVDVKFFNPSVFKIVDLKCGYGVRTGDICHFDNIPSLGAERIQVFLKSPTEEEIGTIEADYKVQFSVEYDYFGESVCYFRILNLEEESAKTKMRSTQTTGPVKVEIELGFLIEEIEDGKKKTISDWAMEGMPFNIEMSAENIGNLGKNFEYPEIKLDDFMIILMSVGVEDEDLSQCDFNVIGNTLTLKESMIIPSKGSPPEPPLKCRLTPAEEFLEPELPGEVRTTYSYRYEFVKTEKIKIVPA